MLIKITTRKGVIISSPNSDTVRFNNGSIEFFDSNQRGTRVERKDLLSLEVYDIQDFELNYKLNGTDVSSSVTNNTDIITVRIKPKWIRLLIVWLFGPLIIKP